MTQRLCMGGPKHGEIVAVPIGKRSFRVPGTSQLVAFGAPNVAPGIVEYELRRLIFLGGHAQIDVFVEAGVWAYANSKLAEKIEELADSIPAVQILIDSTALRH